MSAAAALFVSGAVAGTLAPATFNPRLPPLVPGFPQALAFRLELPPEDKIPDGPEGNEEGEEHHKVYPELGAYDVHLLEELPRGLVVTVGLRAVQRLPVKAVYAQQRALETVPAGRQRGGVRRTHQPQSS